MGNRDFDLSLTQDFDNKYQQLIIDTTKPLPDGYMRCFEGFVDDIYVQIGRTSYEANGIDKPDFACFRFRNTLEPIDMLKTMPVKYTVTYNGDEPYARYQFKISDFEKYLPAEFTNILLKERDLSESSSTTNFSRLVAGCVDKLVLEVNGEIEKLEVHHYDKNSLNDVWHNLIPVTKLEHDSYFHLDKYPELADFKALTAGILMARNILQTQLTEEFIKKCCKKFIYLGKNPEELIEYKTYKFPHKNKGNHIYKSNNDDVMFAAHYLKHVKGLKGRDFDELGEKYNNIKLPSGRTLRKYLMNSFYREFDLYYAFITGDIEKLSTIQNSSQNITFEKYPGLLSSVA